MEARCVSITHGGVRVEFAYEVRTEKSVDEAVAAVQAHLTEKKFSVLWELNVNETLKSKGFDLAHEVRILEVCSAPKAKGALETNPMVAYFLPCKIVVKRVEGQTTIGLTRPSALMGLMGDARFDDLARQVEADLSAVVDAAAR